MSENHGLTPDGLLDPDVVFADPIPGLVPIGRYAEPCLIPEEDHPDAATCPLCGVRHRMDRLKIECWGGRDGAT